MPCREALESHCYYSTQLEETSESGHFRDLGGPAGHLEQTLNTVSGATLLQVLAHCGVLILVVPGPSVLLLVTVRQLVVSHGDRLLTPGHGVSTTTY